ncbi:ACP S-malonyltransferase [Viridibacillus sp. YIM B01967]|uniref:[acyl-carrier-protein] S-malonyltransferase n=1 Tax=Viridibacillus soli TaxID=2798301 RepID=A0ABS1H3G4_9BACL|nr:ACP S-malonyltransferase [Viridibacillus soli]MBK3493952.1 ACP S-malonyltransferase [Viridibacillus soli]
MKKIALLFPGQGSQYLGMGKNYYDSFHTVRTVFEEANDTLGFDLKKLCFEGSLEELSKTNNTQPTLLAVSVAYYKVYMQEIGIIPKYAAGHSLGEFSALTCSGAITFSDALKMVRKRGELMAGTAGSNRGVMVAINGLEQISLKELCSQYSHVDNPVVIACNNLTLQNVISGMEDAVDIVVKKAVEKGAKVSYLNVSAPFHSPYMKLAANQFKKELQQYKFNKPKWSILSNVTALPYEGDDMSTILAEQMLMPVKWNDTMSYLEKQNVDAVIEMGPNMILKHLWQKKRNGIEAFAIEDHTDFMELYEKKCEAGKNTEVINKCIATVVCTRNRNWNEEEYVEGVIKLYKKMQFIQNKIEEEDREPMLEEINEITALLRTVLKTKKVPFDEVSSIFEQIEKDLGII